jgi:hypothetical protein
VAAEIAGESFASVVHTTTCNRHDDDDHVRPLVPTRRSKGRRGFYMATLSSGWQPARARCRAARGERLRSASRNSADAGRRPQRRRRPRQLLDDGHKADESGDSWTALIRASRSGSIEAINLLLDSGADVNLPGSTGDNWDATPLQHAILQRQAAAVRLLLDRGADLNRSAGPGSLTPLLLAAGDTDPAILKFLLAHGADPTVENENGAMP